MSLLVYAAEVDVETSRQVVVAQKLHYQAVCDSLSNCKRPRWKQLSHCMHAQPHGLVLLRSSPALGR